MRRFIRRIETHEMGSGGILPTLLLLGLPAAVAGITQTLFEVADVLFISWLGKPQISGVALIGPLIFTAFAVGQAVNVGVAALLSRHLGEKRPDLARDTLNHGLAISLIVGVVFTAVALASLDWLLRLLGGDSAIVVYAREYSSVVFFGIVLIQVGSAADGALRAQGNTVSPMKIGIVANLANIVLDWAFIFGFGFGVRGAAVATLITRLGMVIAYLVCLYSPQTEIRPGKPDGMPLFWRWNVVGRIYWVGLPASVGMAAMSITMVFINRLLVGMNPYSVGMLGIAWRIESFAFTPVFGLFSAVVPMVGYNLGARLYHRCGQTIWTAAAMAAVAMGSVGALVFAFPAFFFGLFSKDPELLPMAVEYLRIILPVYPVIAVSIMLSAGYQGLGRSWIGMLAHVWRCLIVELPLAYWFASMWGLAGVWWSFPASTMCTVGIFAAIMVRVLRRLPQTIPPVPGGHDEAPGDGEVAVDELALAVVEPAPLTAPDLE